MGEVTTYRRGGPSRRSCWHPIPRKGLEGKELPREPVEDSCGLRRNTAFSRASAEFSRRSRRSSERTPLSGRPATSGLIASALIEERASLPTSLICSLSTPTSELPWHKGFRASTGPAHAHGKANAAGA